MTPWESVGSCWVPDVLFVTMTNIMWGLRSQICMLCLILASLNGKAMIAPHDDYTFSFMQVTSLLKNSTSLQRLLSSKRSG